MQLSSSGWVEVPGFSTSNYPFPQSLCSPARVARTDEHRALGIEAITALARLTQLGAFPPFIIASQATLELISAIARARDSRAPLLITGETGTGKELLARAALIEDKIVIDADLPYHKLKDEMERLYIAHALRKVDGNLKQAAARMKMSPFGLRKAIKRLGIKVESESHSRDS